MSGAGEVVATLKDVRTGEIRVYRERVPSIAQAAWLYMWTEGNYSCDCNRELFFCRAAGAEEPEETECTVGENRFRLLRLECPDGVFENEAELNL